jgi:phosphate transport system regulatory protein PhoU
VVEHTVKAYDKELDTLGRRIAEMGGIAEKMVIDAMDALANADSTLAHQVVVTDPRLDVLQREIEDFAVMTIARRQPVAIDLREVIGAIRVAGDLERVGDLAKNIAKRSVKIGVESRVSRAIIGIKHMNEVATELMKDVLDSYAQSDIERAREVWEGRRSRHLGGLGLPRFTDPFSNRVRRRRFHHGRELHPSPAVFGRMDNHESAARRRHLSEGEVVTSAVLPTRALAVMVTKRQGSSGPSAPSSSKNGNSVRKYRP